VLQDLSTALALLITATVLMLVSGLNMKWIGVAHSRYSTPGIAFYFLVLCRTGGIAFSFVNPDADRWDTDFRSSIQNRGRYRRLHGMGYGKECRSSYLRMPTRISSLP
jgi:cell division protein FtsW (lipid II flippase)